MRCAAGAGASVDGGPGQVVQGEGLQCGVLQVGQHPSILQQAPRTPADMQRGTALTMPPPRRGTVTP